MSGATAWWGFALALIATQTTLQWLNAFGKTELDFWPFSVGNPKATALAAWYSTGVLFCLVGFGLSF